MATVRARRRERISPKLASRIAVISLAMVSLTYPSIVAAQAPDGQRGTFQSKTEDHPSRRAPALTEPQYYRPCPASVVLANGRHECLG